MLSTPQALLRLAAAFLLTTALEAAPVTLTAPLPEARAAVAALKARGPLPAGGVIVEIPAGVYPLSSILTPTAADGATIGFIRPGKAFTHRACPSTAVIS